MSFVTPYITNKFTAYLGDIISTRLSVAVWLIDDFTKKEPIGNVRVAIEEGDIKAVKNPSGYYIFTDLAGGEHTISVESDLYFLEKKPVDNTPGVKLEFDASGPAAKATSVKLKDVSKLQADDAVEFRNSSGEIEQRSLTRIDTDSRTIYWDEELIRDFTSNSTVHILKHLIVEILLKPIPNYPFPATATLIRGSFLSKDPSNPVKVKAGDRMETVTNDRGEFVLYFKGAKKGDVIPTIYIQGKRYPQDVKVQKEGERKALGIISFP
ncbi:MAG: hypothetical protein WA130_10100 [Candidatus Methanoperedens sp.]